MTLLRLAVPSPLRKSYVYLPPSDMSDAEVGMLQPGIRIKAPFGRRSVVAVLLAVISETDVARQKLRPVQEIVDDSPLLTAAIYELCLWSAQYYLHPIGDVFQHAFPKVLRQGGSPYRSSESAWELTTEGSGLPLGALKSAPKQALLLNLLQQGQVTRSQMLEQGINTATARALINKGLAIKTTKSQSDYKTQVSVSKLSLNTEQEQAVNSIENSLGSFSCQLLDGITGSGKTEVYLQSIATCIARGLQALVLIPEIGLTPQTLERFQQRFGHSIAVFHSNLSDSERVQAWESARCGDAAVILGTRSAVFTPTQKLGLVIIDEEHDSSYKQQEGFRYNARDVAIKRAQIESVPIVLGSATPSLESIHNAATGRFQYLQLQHRTGNAQPPKLRCIDVRRVVMDNGLSSELLESIRRHLENNNQVLVFINRRGYAPSLLCHDCGWIASCPHCDSRLTVHKDYGLLRCHYCDYQQKLVQQCPDCRSSRLIYQGVGTQRCEQALNRLFPDIPVFRIDRDSTQRKAAMSDIIDKIHQTGPCLLVGTQMLAKGHHFPNVTLVAIIDADAALFNADFRSEERMGQLLTQVSGRAGRADKSGEVLIQTHYPQHPLLLTLIDKGYGPYAQQLLAERADSQLPPCGHLVLIRADHKTIALADSFLQRIRESLTAVASQQNVHFYGPLPSPKPRRGGNYHLQLLIGCARRGPLHQLTEQLIAMVDEIPGAQRPRWSIDVDPQDMI